MLIRKDLNLLPSNIIKQRKNRERLRVATLASILVVVCFLSFIAVSYTRMLSLKAQEKELKAMIESKNELYTMEKELEKDRAILAVRQAVLATTEGAGDEILHILELLEDSMPQDLFVENISFGGNSLTLTGTSKSSVAIADFIRSVKDLGIFDDVYVPAISGGNRPDSQDKDSARNFSMECTLKKAEGN